MVYKTIIFLPIYYNIVSENNARGQKKITNENVLYAHDVVITRPVVVTDKTTRGNNNNNIIILYEYIILLLYTL